LNYSSLQRELDKGVIRPAYLFTGKEDFLAEAGVKVLTAKLLTDDERDLNLNVFYGRDADRLQDALMSPPIFAARRVVVVRHAQELSVKQLDGVIRYLQNPPADGCLILWAGDLDKRKTFHKRTEGLLEPVLCGKLKDTELSQWMHQQTSARGKKLEEGAVQRLSVLEWPGLRELASELDRLMLMVGDKDRITAEDVEEMGGGSYEFERWALSEAVGAGDLAKALQTVENLQTWSAKGTQIIGDLHRLLRQLWFLRYHIEKKTTDEAKRALHLHEFVFGKLLRQAQRCPMVALEDALLRVLEADLSIKRGLRPDSLEASLVVADVVRLLTPVQPGKR